MEVIFWRSFSKGFGKSFKSTHTFKKYHGDQIKEAEGLAHGSFVGGCQMQMLQLVFASAEDALDKVFLNENFHKNSSVIYHCR